MYRLSVNAMLHVITWLINTGLFHGKYVTVELKCKKGVF